MSVYQGGSASNMVSSMADGYIILTERTFKNYKPNELAEFLFETERLLRETRADAPAADDKEAVREVCVLLDAYDAFNRSRAAARDQVEQADAALALLPPSVARDCFGALTDYVVQRDR